MSGIGSQFYNNDNDRNIYYDKRKNKNIYGKATQKETEELKEEGIELTTVPWIDKREDN